MKKITLLIITMLLLTLTAAYAQVDLKPTITGSATCTLGVDLANGGTGLLTETSSSIALTLVSGSETKGADADVYGTITLKDFKIGFDNTATIDLTDATNWKDSNGNDIAIELAVTGSTTEMAKTIDKDTFKTRLIVNEPSIEAKIVLSPAMAVVIASKPTIDWNKASQIDQQLEVKTAYNNTDGGVALKISSAPVNVDIVVISNAKAQDNSTNAYAFGANGGLKVGTLDIGFYGAMGVNYASNPIGVGLALSTNLGMVSPFVAADLKIDSAANTLDAQVKLPITVAPLTLTLEASMATDLAVTSAMDLDVKAGLGLKAAGADISATLTLKNMIVSGSLGTVIEGSASYAMGKVTPSVTAKYDMGVNSVTTDDIATLTAKIDMALIPNTVFTLQYANDQLIDNQTTSSVTAQDAGLITFAAKISY